MVQNVRRGALWLESGPRAVFDVGFVRRATEDLALVCAWVNAHVYDRI